MTTATLPTAYHADMKKFFRWGCPEKRDLLFTQLKETVLSAGINFERLFPNKSKRKDVLKRIFLLLSHSGICTVESKTLADGVGCSVRTVFDAVEKLKETGEVLVTGLADGSNKYVFVLKSHENFNQILKEVFFMDDLPTENAPIAEPIAEQIAEPENLESLGAVGVEDDFSGSESFKSFRSLSSKQERSYIQQSIENDIQDSERNIAETRKKLVVYTANENQLMLFDNIINHGFPQAITDKAGILALRVGMDCDVNRRFKAYQLLCKIASNMTDGVEIRNIVAVFSEGLDKPLDRYEIKAPVAPKARTVKRVPFYNWLEERD